MQNQPGPPQWQEPWQPPYPPPAPKRGLSSGTIVALVFGGIVLVVCAGSCGLVLFIGSDSPSVPAANVSVPDPSVPAANIGVPSGVLPEIQRFLDSHREFGDVVAVQDVPDWAQGKRQRATLNTAGHRRQLLFYVKGAHVVTIYEDGTEGRKKVWGEFSVDTAADPKKKRK